VRPVLIVVCDKNKREIWDETAEWLRNGVCLPNHPELKIDLCTPTYSFNSHSKMVLESKSDNPRRHRPP
jgi:hypothetical protein